MIIHTVELTVPNASAEQFYDFMINPTDECYSAWWPGEHLQFHIVKRGAENHFGDVVFMDEYLGWSHTSCAARPCNRGKNHRLVFNAVVTVAERPNKITWQMIKAGVRLPAFVTLELHDSPGWSRLQANAARPCNLDGVMLKHELRIGYSGFGKILDPFIRLYFNKSFQNALDEHCKIEWYYLAHLLS